MKRLILIATTGLIILIPTFVLAQQGETPGRIVKLPPLSLSNSSVGANIANNLANSPVVKFFSNWTADDLASAIELSSSIPELQDDVGKACWQTFAAMGEVIKKHPVPATLNLATDIEGIRLFNMAIKKVCQKPECSQVWNDIQNQISALAPIPLPISLGSVCAKIP